MKSHFNLIFKNNAIPMYYYIWGTSLHREEKAYNFRTYYLLQTKKVTFRWESSIIVRYIIIFALEYTAIVMYKFL